MPLYRLRLFFIINFFAFIFEEVVLSNILPGLALYCMQDITGGIAFTLQMYAQKNIEEAMQPLFIL